MLTKDLYKQYLDFVRKQRNKFEINEFGSKPIEDYSKFISKGLMRFLTNEGIDFGLTLFIADAFTFYRKYGDSIEYSDFLNPKLLSEIDEEAINWYRLSYLTSKDNSIFKYPPPYELDTMHSDERFQKKHPEHPLAEANRFPRQDTLLDFNHYFLKIVGRSKEDIYELSDAGKIFIDRYGLPYILNKLHFILFDCSASVRDRCLDAINAIADKSSENALRKLIENEKESVQLSRKASAILDKILR